ncbi:MAG: hypothetical protein EA402_13060 [Planctomycetota bacterium]|nr:MAG: hypothetical protein EA402_13060 [Planctomycetota bacterium]
MRFTKSLQGLRLNCWLAGILPAVVAALILLWLGETVSAYHRAEIGDGLRRSLQAHIQPDQPAQLKALVASDPIWRGSQILAVLAGGVVEIRESFGEIFLEVDHPPPELILAVTQGRWWAIGPKRFAAAVPMLDAEGQFRSLLYAEATFADSPLRSWFALIASVVLVMGAAMAWYLGRRIYRPVTALTDQASAALTGRMMPLAMRSPETQDLASAVTQLAESYVGQRSSEVPLGDRRSTVQTVVSEAAVSQVSAAESAAEKEKPADPRPPGPPTP